jgi:uncharacterized protein (DUF1330 family)
MSAYVVFTRDKTVDEQELDAYSKEAPTTLAGHEVNVLASYGAHEDLEGAATERTVIIEFPGAAAAKAWYNGPAYRKVREHRFRGSTYRVTLVEGVRGSRSPQEYCAEQGFVKCSQSYRGWREERTKSRSTVTFGP